MAGESKYYWIKLRTDFFNQDTIDFLMSQKNGCSYIVLYQMLCLKTANSNGQFSTKVGEMIIPYDVDKIVRDTKYFDFDTVTVALELFKRLGLIYENENNILTISDYGSMIGSESASRDAERQRKSRAKRKMLQEVTEDCDKMSQKNVTKSNTDIRDKRLDIRDKILDKEIEKEKGEAKASPTQKKLFVKPNLDEIKAYCNERRNSVDAERFFDYYESNGWKVGKNPMKDWKAAVRTWERNGFTAKETKTNGVSSGIVLTMGEDGFEYDQNGERYV